MHPAGATPEEWARWLRQGVLQPRCPSPAKLGGPTSRAATTPGRRSASVSQRACRASKEPAVVCAASRGLAGFRPAATAAGRARGEEQVAVRSGRDDCFHVGAVISLGADDTLEFRPQRARAAPRRQLVQIAQSGSAAPSHELAARCRVGRNPSSQRGVGPRRQRTAPLTLPVHRAAAQPVRIS
jgi:hypothetical protein